MGKINTWISAARLRTLPLSISGILVGSSIAAAQEEFNWLIFILALATTLGLQILSNFANDYGDFVKGTDNEDRVGPERALQSGRITKREMFRGMVTTGILTFMIALALIFVSFGARSLLFGFLFIILVLAAIAAAVLYTVGKSAYGYRGLGDIFVFLFFGIVGVYGCYFLYTIEWDWRVLLPSCTIGFLSAGVLNLNNMRDRLSDKKAGKFTLVVKIGEARAKKYHYLLMAVSVAAFIIFSILAYTEIDDFLYVIAFVPIFLHVKRVRQNEDPRKLDPELKQLALGTFFLALLFSLGQVI